MSNREFKNVKINVEFQETANRQQISSGDEIKTLFGKIKKWFSDLKAIAFTGSYNDLLDTPSIPKSKEDIGLKNIDDTSDMDKPVSTAQQSAINAAVSTHNDSGTSHSDIRNLITGLTTRLNALADSDDTTLDQLSEIVAYIKSNKNLIDSITTSKLNVSDLVDDLTSTSTKKGLTANQGHVLKELLDAMTTTVGKKVDSVTGKGLSTNDYTTVEKNKLSGIASGAEVNVQADWNVTDTTSDAYIKNKPTIPQAATKESVGLGNVPNVSTNDQTPTFTRSSSRSNITSGEKLSTMLGKISKYFWDMKTVAFTGNYKDLSDKPNLPSKRNFKQETYLFNSTNGKRYVKIAGISPINNVSSTMFGIILKLINGDYQMYSQATVHFGFASWDGSNYIDWGGFETIDGWDKNTTIANSSTGSKSLKNMLVLVRDPVDPFCFELWVKLETYCTLYIGLDHYMEVYTTGTYPNVTIYGYGNESEHNFQPVSFWSGDDLVYLDHIPTSSDGYGNEDYPEVVFGNWT